MSGTVGDLTAVVAAAVLLIPHGQLVAPLGVQLQTLPVLVAALAVDEGGAAQCDGALVVFGLGGDLILKGQVGIFCKSQGQGAGGVVLSGIAGRLLLRRSGSVRRSLVRGAAGLKSAFLSDKNPSYSKAAEATYSISCLYYT